MNSHNHNNIDNFRVKEAYYLLDLVFNDCGRRLNANNFFQELSQKKIDIHAFYSFAQHHRCEGLLYQLLCDNIHYNIDIPSKILISLNQKFETNMLRNFAFHKSSVSISKELRNNSIKHVFIKGSSSLLHGKVSPGEKTTNDLDLLINHEQLHEGIQILQDLGFVYGEYCLYNRKIIEHDIEELTDYAISPFKYHHLKYPFAIIDNKLPGSAIRVEVHVSCSWRNSDQEHLPPEILFNMTHKEPFSRLNIIAETAVLILQFYRDFVSTWDNAVRNKDCELFRICEIARLLQDSNGVELNKIFINNHFIYKYVLNIINHLTNESLDLTDNCPDSFCHIGLPPDRLKAIFNGSNYDRFISPGGRYNFFDHNILQNETNKRASFWVNLDSNISKTDLRKQLLAKTIKYLSLKSPFYSKTFRQNNIIDENDFDNIPQVSKTELTDNGTLFVCDPSPQIYHSIITGSTTGKPLILFRSSEEIKRVSSLSETCHQAPSSFNLQLFSGNHGAPSLSAIPNGMIMPVKFKAHFELISEYLESGVPTPEGRKNIDYLVGGLVAIKRLFTYMKEKNLISNILPLKGVVTSGTYLTDMWRRKLQGHFKTKITQMFGLSEFSQGVAVETNMPGCFNFPITVLPNISSIKNVSDKIGELEMTHLYPFADLQPILRYKTGDLVKDCGFFDEYNDRIYRYLGRINSAGFTENKGIIPATAIAEVLERFEYSCYRPDTANSKGIINDSRLCNTVFRIHNLSDQVQIKIEVTDRDGASEIGTEQIMEDIINETYAQVGCYPEFTIKCTFVDEETFSNKYVFY
ncbi:MAG: nucleotidyltransferase family protein [Deltaproteobacteria bacterium]|jgi:phenylacetate-coenzyme A ligase PaaK-like adenylate-forming protein|nr:nucleotidyltransferase family protein [Deltaproteobacteria bacterium]